MAFDELINLSERLKPAIELADNLWQSVLDSSLTSGSLVGGLLGGAAVLGGFLLIRRLKRGTRRSTCLQKTLDALPDAVALFNPKGQLTALNRKAQKLMPLEIDTSAFPETTTSDLYAQISPDNLAIERARNRAREALNDPNATLNFEVPSYGRRALLVKERMTETGGVAISLSLIHI